MLTFSPTNTQKKERENKRKRQTDRQTERWKDRKTERRMGFTEITEIWF